MKALLLAFALFGLASNEAWALKAHYGHYYATDYGDNTTTDIDVLCGKKGVTGINYRMRWRDIEAQEGVFTWTAWDNVVTRIQNRPAPVGTFGTGSYIPNNTCALWLLPEWKLFSAVGGSGNPCPLWLKDQNGNPGFAPNDQGNGGIIISIASGAASVTNTSPIVVTTSAAHSFANGDTVFVDNVAGNKAANGFWVVSNKTATTITLTGSHGNGTRVTSGTPVGWYGRVSRGANFDCKMWDPTVRDKFNAMITAMGAHFDGVANVEGFIMQESSISMSNAAYNDAPGNGGDYNHVNYTAAYISYMQTCSAAFPTSRCLAFLNIIQSGQNADLQLVSEALTALPNNQGCYGGPDILPNNNGLVNGTYQVLVKHVGCRSNSAQNTTIVGSQAGAVACAPNDCNEIFSFTVRGTFGILTLPLGADEGLCVNSYLFWNDSTAERAKVDPTIQANPYGIGWYGQCSCGGTAP